MKIGWRWLIPVGKAVARGAQQASADHELAAARRELQTLREDRDYWRQRCELLLDQLAVKAGHTPVMMLNQPAAVGSVFRGLAMTEVPKKADDSDPKGATS
ncbi:MAG: hypothetical protein IT181_13145 [Acidobacteria bacterium]|nr:hypothetical protein [Acidobacteriota bacterium]